MTDRVLYVRDGRPPSCGECGVFDEPCAEVRTRWLPTWERERRVLGADGPVVCRGSRVAGVFRPIDAGFAPLARELQRSAEAPGSGRPALRVTMEGDVILVSQVTCGECARIMGWSLLAKPSLLPDDVLAELQVHLGLPPLPLLRTTDALADAL
jgi:hypothetical protein